jgi:hypothetical protein
MELPNSGQLTTSTTKVSKWRNVGDKLKRCAYIIIALINGILPLLISLGVISIASPIVLVAGGICSVCLIIASKSEDLEKLIEKYDLNNNKIVIKLDDIQSMADDIASIKNIVKSSTGSNSARSISANEPISSTRTEIKTRTPRCKAWYNKDLNVIEIEYSENSTPR